MAIQESAENVGIRPFRPGDATQVVKLSRRLRIGVATWRAPEAVDAAIDGWIEQAIAAAGTDHSFVIIAETRPASAIELVGFVAGNTLRHWTGAIDVDLGELVVADGFEGRGIGRRLVSAAEDWARAHGHRRMSVRTGWANERARALYTSLGFVAEDVSFSRAIGP